MSQQLPEGWEMKYDWATKKFFYVDHNTKKTTWEDPRKTIQQKEESCSSSTSSDNDSPKQVNQVSFDGYDFNSTVNELVRDYPEFPRDKIAGILNSCNNDKAKARQTLDKLLMDLLHIDDSPAAKKRHNTEENRRKEDERARVEKEIIIKEQEEKRKHEEEYKKRMVEEEKIRRRKDEEERKRRAEQEEKRREEMEKKRLQDEADRKKRRLEEEKRMQEMFMKQERELKELNNKTISSAAYINKESNSNAQGSKAAVGIIKNSTSPHYKGPANNLAKGPNPSICKGPNTKLVNCKKNYTAKGSNPSNIARSAKV